MLQGAVEFARLSIASGKGTICGTVDERYDFFHRRFADLPGRYLTHLTL